MRSSVLPPVGLGPSWHRHHAPSGTPMSYIPSHGTGSVETGIDIVQSISPFRGAAPASPLGDVFDMGHIRSRIESIDALSPDGV